MLKTERLLLRRWTEEDADDLFRYASDPDVGPVAGWPPHESREESLDVIRNILNGPECYAVCRKEDGKAIGAIELKLNGHSDMTDRDTECELGYWLGKPFWGKGYMPEAVRALLRHGFEDLDMTTIWCGYYDGNERSKRVQEKCGFRYHHTCADVPVPLLHETRVGHTNVLTREEWEKQENLRTTEKKILFIDACARSESRTRELAEALLKRLKGRVETVSLYLEEIPTVDAEVIRRRITADKSGDFSDSIFQHAKQFAIADEIVIAAPYWDLSFPACLKKYMEWICVSGITFRYSDAGVPIGLCRARRLYYITTAGGPILDTGFGFGYIKALTESILGIRDCRMFSAENLDILGNDPKKIMAEAMKQIREAELTD